MFHRGKYSCQQVCQVFLGRVDFVRNFPETSSSEVPFRVGYLWVGLLLQRELFQLSRWSHDDACVIPQRGDVPIRDFVSFFWAELIFSVISQKLILSKCLFGSDICSWGFYLRVNYFSQVGVYTVTPALFHKGVISLLGIVLVFFWAQLIFSSISQKLILLKCLFGSDICRWGSYLREIYFI